MNTLRKQILASLSAVAMAGLTFAAQAQTAPAPAEGRHGFAASQEQRAAAMTEHFAKRQAKLHDLLKITAAQEGAWATYQAAIKPVAPTAPAAGDHAAWAALSAPARLQKGIDMMKAHTAKMEASLPALNAFYGVLTAEQKAIFDKAARGGHGGPGGRGGFGGHGGPRG